MNNQVFGVLVIAFCVFLYWIAWKKQVENKMTIAVVLLLLGGLALRIFTSLDFYLHPWDERYHALVAKNLMHHPLIPTLYDNPILSYDYKNWIANHVWLHKQPLALWSIALSFKIFGVNVIALRLPAIILSTLGILIVYKIGRMMFSQRVGFIAAFLFSIHGLIIELSAGRVATDSVDISFLFFIELAVYFALLFAKTGKVKFNILTALSVGAAIMSKYLPALIVLPIWLLFVIQYKQVSLKKSILQFLLLVSIILVIVLPWQIYIHQAFPQEALWESNYNLRHFTEIIEEQTGGWFYHFSRMRILFGEIIYLPLIWLIYKSIKSKRNLIRWSLLVWILIPVIFFSLAKTKMQGYILFTAPALFILTALFWDYLYRFKNLIKYKWLNYIILILLIGLPVRYSFERIKPFDLTSRSPVWAEELIKLNQIPHSSKSVIFNISRPVETMFYTDFIAYDFLPDVKEIREIKEKGYDIFIANDSLFLSGEDGVKHITLKE